MHHLQSSEFEKNYSGETLKSLLAGVGRSGKGEGIKRSLPTSKGKGEGKKRERASGTGKGGLRKARASGILLQGLGG